MIKPRNRTCPIVSILSNPNLKKNTEPESSAMSPARARQLSGPKARSTSSRSSGCRTSSEVKDDTSLNDSPYNPIILFVSSSGWMYLPCVSFAFGHHYLMSFASLRYTFSTIVRYPCAWDGSKLGSWSSFCLEPVLSCFSTISLASVK